MTTSRPARPKKRQDMRQKIRLSAREMQCVHELRVLTGLETAHEVVGDAVMGWLNLQRQRHGLSPVWGLPGGPEYTAHPIGADVHAASADGAGE